MRSTRTTAYFTGQIDERPVGRAMMAVLNDPTIRAMAAHVLDHLDPLLEDLSLLLLRNTRTQDGVAPPISQQYANMNGGMLDPEQRILAQYLDQVYAASDAQTLNVRRGAMLERLVFDAVAMRKKQPGDDVVSNLDHLKFPERHERARNGYSVDIAACFSRSHSVELYACKLRSEHMPDADLKSLDELGEYFAQRYYVITAFCCLEMGADLDPDFLQRVNEYDSIEVITVDNFETLMEEDHPDA